MVAVKSLYLQQTCVFSLSIFLVMCSCNLSMELSRTFLFSYLSFCNCHLLLSVFWLPFAMRWIFLLPAMRIMYDYCLREGSTCSLCEFLTAGQPPTPTIYSAYKECGGTCTYRRWWGLVVVWLSWLSGRALAAQARGVQGSTQSGCWPFSLSSFFWPHNFITLL